MKQLKSGSSRRFPRLFAVAVTSALIIATMPSVVSGAPKSPSDASTTATRPSKATKSKGATRSTSAQLRSVQEAVQHDVVASQLVTQLAAGPSRAIVELRTGASSGFSSSARADRRADIAASGSRVKQSLRGATTVVQQPANVPALVIDIATPQELLDIANLPDVAAVFDDAVFTETTSQSFPIVNQPQAVAAGYQGAGVVVAVIDSGADYTHPDLGSCVAVGPSCRVIQLEEAPGAADGLADCGSKHGTNVSSIIAKMAPAAELMVFDSATACTGSHTSSDLIWAMNRVVTLKNGGANIRVVNLSLGGGDCGAAGSIDAAFRTMLANGILPVVASGNQGYTDTVSNPGCLPDAIAVGATADYAASFTSSTCSQTFTVDTILCFSNSSDELDILAPGGNITAGGLSMFGTSQATPHVAGAAAILAAARPSASTAQIRVALQNTGLLINDARNGVARRRLDVFAAANALVNQTPLGIANDQLANAQTVTVGTFPGTTAGGTVEQLETNNATLDTGDDGQSTVWFQYTPPEGGTLLVDTCTSAFDSTLTIGTGTTHPLTRLAYNDDSGTCADDAQVSIPVVAGQPYKFSIGGWAGGQGAYVLHVAFTPTNAGKLMPGIVLTKQMTGLNGIPSTGVSAVALNVTATQPSAGGYITVFPCGAVPNASNLNFEANQTVANAVISPVSPQGEVCFFSSAATYLIVDVTGYYPTGVTGLQSLTPVRTLDTRDSTKPLGGAITTLHLTGTNGIPGASVGAVALNVTVTEPEGDGWVTVFPCGAVPNVSSVNFRTGQTVPNSVIAPLSSGGDICLQSTVRAHLLVDVTGWFPVSASGFTPVAPVRMFDSRSGLGSIPATSVAAGGSGLTFSVVNKNGVPATGVAAVSFNLTATSPSGDGYVTVYPCGTKPEASSLNFAVGQTIANAVVSSVSVAGNVCFWTSAGTHLIADVNGWFPVSASGYQALTPVRIIDLRQP